MYVRIIVLNSVPADGGENLLLKSWVLLNIGRGWMTLKVKTRLLFALYITESNI